MDKSKKKCRTWIETCSAGNPTPVCKKISKPSSKTKKIFSLVPLCGLFGRFVHSCARSTGSSAPQKLAKMVLPWRRRPVRHPRNFSLVATSCRCYWLVVPLTCALGPSPADGRSSSRLAFPPLPGTVSSLVPFLSLRMTGILL